VPWQGITIADAEDTPLNTRMTAINTGRSDVVIVRIVITIEAESTPAVCAPTPHRPAS
jgi:hypothetical protein